MIESWLMTLLSAPDLCSELESFLENLPSQSILMSFSGEVYALCSRELRHGHYGPNWCPAAECTALFLCDSAARRSHGDIHISNDTAVLLGRGFTASLSLFLSVCFSWLVLLHCIFFLNSVFELCADYQKSNSCQSNPLLNSQLLLIMHYF